MSNKLVSVMLPVFNGDQTLDLAIRSLLAQTYPYWQAVVVNDGSTDNTWSYLEQLEDDRLVVVHLDENKGRPFARQKALDLAQGDYLAFLDADDFYHPEKLARQVDFMEEHPNVDLLGCGMGSFRFPEEGLLRVRGAISMEPSMFKIGRDVPVVHAASMLRLSKAKEVKYDLRLQFAQDMDYLNRYLDQKFFANIPDVLYFYSEFESVTGSKILHTRWYGLLRRWSLISIAPLRVIRSIIILLLKWVITALILPFAGAEYFIRKRGREPNQREKAEFAQIWEDLKNEIKKPEGT